jgi:transposase
VRSSRSLEREAHRNIEVIWLVRGLKPDFKTIADFGRDNHAAFRAVFRQFVLLRRRRDLYGRALLAVDGTPDGVFGRSAASSNTRSIGATPVPGSR